jgi:GDP-L-fucose synthase
MVGSAITRKLVSEGYNNLVFTPYPEYDLTNQAVVTDFFKKETPEYVFLAAAKVGGIVANNTYRAQFIYENMMIQSNIIHQSYLNGVKKLLFLGSSCIYPKNCPQPIKEEYLLTGELEYTNEPYAIAKIAGLKMCEAYNNQYGTNFISVMPTNLYGPNDNYNLETSHVLPALIRKMHLGKCLENNDWGMLLKDLKMLLVGSLDDTSSKLEILNLLSKYGIQYTSETENSELRIGNKAPGNKRSVEITLWGSGSPCREFLYVDDLANACFFIMNNVDFNDLKDLHGAQSPEPYAHNLKPKIEIINTHINIGTGIDLTIRELAELIRSIVGFEGVINWDNSKPDGTFRKLLDVSRIKNLGWEYKISLEEGIQLVYQNYLN